MAQWKAKQNADFFTTYSPSTGQVSGKVVGVKAGETITASDLLNGVLDISGVDRWTKKEWFDLVSVTPPPPPPPPPPAGELPDHFTAHDAAGHVLATYTKNVA